MITKRYKVPFMGTVLNTSPLTGAADDPIRPIPFDDLPGYSQLQDRGVSSLCTSLTYDVDEGWVVVDILADEEFHTWLQELLPNLGAIARDTGCTIKRSDIEEEK